MALSAQTQTKLAALIGAGAASELQTALNLATLSAQKSVAYTDNYNSPSSTLAAYNSSACGTTFTATTGSTAGATVAKVADLETLRIAYENLRTSYDSLIQVVSKMLTQLSS